MDQAGDARGRVAGGRRGADDREGLSAHSLRELFLLDPEIVFLNHGDHGACPRPVFEEYQRWQLELELRPVEFLSRRYLMNMAVRSLELRPGEEIVTSGHEYGAVDLLWGHLCARTGARIVRRRLRPGPGLLGELWAGVSERTRAQAAGILSFIDGAHAPGQLELDLDSLGADVYAGNCRKWLCAPKGAASSTSARSTRSGSRRSSSAGASGRTTSPRATGGAAPRIRPPGDERDLERLLAALDGLG